MTGQRLQWTHSGFTLPRTQLTTLPLSLTFQVLQGRSVTHHIHDSATRRRKTYTRTYTSTGRTDTHTHTQGEFKTLRATHNLPRPCGHHKIMVAGRLFTQLDLFSRPAVQADAGPDTQGTDHKNRRPEHSGGPDNSTQVSHGPENPNRHFLAWNLDTLALTV